MWKHIRFDVVLPPFYDCRRATTSFLRLLSSLYRFVRMISLNAVFTIPLCPNAVSECFQHCATLFECYARNAFFTVLLCLNAFFTVPFCQMALSGCFLHCIALKDEFFE
jgi:hypothetical protein